jgi:hypothetical protein
LRQCASRGWGATCSARRASWWSAFARVLPPPAAQGSWHHLLAIASVSGPDCGTHNCGGRKPAFSCGSGKPLLSGFVRRLIDQYAQHLGIILIARLALSEHPKLSAAQALAIVFASPRLLDVPCRTIEQMRLVNALAAVKGRESRSSGITTGGMISGNGFSIYRRDHKIIHKLTIAFNTLTKLALRPAKRSKSS